MNNIEINDKLETDIENKYIKYKENVKFTTEEAIYILKRKDFCDEVENIAIENLIKENKELKEKMKGMYDKSNKLIEVTNLYLNSIPKSKVEEKIEELQEEFEYLGNDNKRVNKMTIEILKELLEEGE